MVKSGAEQADQELADVTVDFKGPAKETISVNKALLETNLAKADAIGIAPVDGRALRSTFNA